MQVMKDASQNIGFLWTFRKSDRPLRSTSKIGFSTRFVDDYFQIKTTMEIPSS